MAWCQWLLLVLLSASFSVAERPSAARTLQSQQERGGYAKLRINTLDKVKVEAISREEAIRLRQTGLRFHEVEHHHFTDRSSKNGKLWQDLKKAAKEQSKTYPWEEAAPDPKPKAARAFKRQNAIGRHNTTVIEGALKKVLAPEQQIRPTRIGGFLCAQFDLDFFVLSGGVFPGLLGIGLLGDIHYSPATQCFGWTAEMYLMLSIGFSLYGMDFRVALVVIATLVVTERPLAAGSKDLVWELPKGFDTSRCHNKNPFTLIASSSREGWRFIYTHILTKKYLKHAEVEVQKYLDENKQDIVHFKRYLDLIEPPRAMPAKLVSASQSQGLAKEGILGNIEVSGSWLSDSIKLEVVLPKNLRVQSSGVSANLMQFVQKVRATMWQDLGGALLSQQSEDCDRPPMHNFSCTFLMPARPGIRAFVQLTMTSFQEFSVPMQLDPSEEHFHFPASFRASRTLQDGTLSCQSLTVHYLDSQDSSCERMADVTDVQLEVKVSSVQASASWTKEDFGEGAPWGINVPQSHHDKNNEEIHTALADAQAQGALVRVYQLQNEQIMSLLAQAAQDLAERHSQSFRQALWAKLRKPTPEAISLLNEKGLQPLVAESLQRLQNDILGQLRDATEEVLVGSNLVESMKVSAEVQKIVDAVIARCSFGERACPEVALRAAVNKPEKPRALLVGLSACAGRKRKDYESAFDGARSRSSSYDPVDTSNVTKLLEDLFPDSKMAGQGPKWVSYGHRTVNSQNCVSIGFLGAGSPEECQAGCDRVDDGDCNTVVFEEDDGWCSLWKCSPWDTFPPQPGKILSFKTDVPPERDSGENKVVIFAGLPRWALDRATSALLKIYGLSADSVAKETLRLLSSIPEIEATWETQLSEKVWGSPETWPKPEVVQEGVYRPLLVDVLLEDSTWMASELMQNILHGHMNSGDGVVLSVAAKNTQGTPSARDFFQFMNDFSGHTGNRWTQPFELSMRGCTIRVETSWVWQVPSSTAYFIRPAMVPVAQSMFAAYDQFVSKLPSYGAQVMQRLKAKKDSRWKASVLPYQSTDGRHLHRHLKKGEQDRVKVHKGEVATDDAVYNFPKAIRESKYRESPNFWYNVGLSAANLFLRVVSDVQALFHLYFADHPDWDGTCQSLPAQFNLLYEWETARVPSNWVMRQQGKRKDMSAKPTHRAGDTVSEQGAPLNADSEAMIKNWHWVSKPRWFNKEDSRAAFFTQTAPTHGKDGWATPDASQLSAKMWPHVWCELVQQEWSTAAAVQEEETLTREGALSALENLASLKEAVPVAAEQIVEKARLRDSAKALERMFAFRLSGPDGGCPVRMVAREKAAVDRLTQPIVIGWATLLQVSEYVLEFYRSIVSDLSDEQEAMEMDTSKQGDGVDDAQAESSAGNETPAEANANSIATSRSSQLETLMDTLSVSSERWKTDGSEERGLRNALLTMWNSLFINMTEADTHAVVEARRLFQENRDKLLALVIAQQERVEQIGEHLDRLVPVTAVPEASEANGTNATNSSKDTSNLKFAIRFATVLTAAAAERQKEAISMFNKLFNCIDVVARPEELPETAFDQWTEQPEYADTTNSFKVEDVRKYLSYGAASSDSHDGAELFFAEACSLPPHTVFSSPEHERFERLSEPRPECERVVLGNAMMSMFPNFASQVLHTYVQMQQTLELMIKHPSSALMHYMIVKLEEFVRRLSTGNRMLGMDTDFYKAFSYRKDGSLVGRLWSNLPSALSEIAATLQMRQEGRKQWITEGIAYRSRLKTARRARVRELEKNKVQIPSKEEGCLCREKWSGFGWLSVFPRAVQYEGCVKLKNKWLAAKSNTSWDGICKTKQDKTSSFEKCRHQYAPCDPEASPTKPQFQIWRAADVLHADPVRLPLLQLDLYLHVDIRNRRADFCTPNFAPIMLDTNWHWSTSSWLPYDLRRSVCYGARIHPPGVSLAVTRCSHTGRGYSRVSKSTEWSVTGVAYLVSHYNTWGTGDGDMTQSWFGGSDNWGSKAMSTGWPNFVMADPGTWASSAGGSGYLQTGNVMSSPSAFWFSLIAEVLSAVSIAEATNSPNTTTATKVAKSIMVSAATVTWRLLQRYAVIPSMWDLMVSTGTVLKTFADIGLKNLAITPFRNEHDVVLSFKMASQWTRRELDLKNLIGDLSLDQMRIVFEEAEASGLPVQEAWKDFQTTAAGSAQDVHNLNRETLMALTRSYLKSATTTHTSFLTSEALSRQLLQDLFRRCPGRPLWYKVHSNARVPIYTFWRPESSSWISPPLPPGTEIMISQWDDDWLRVIAEPEEEDRYIPSRYIATAALQLVGDVISRPSDAPGLGVLQNKIEVENILRRVSKETLRCWAVYIKAAKPSLMKGVIQEAWRTERARISDDMKDAYAMSHSMIGVVDGVAVPLGFFSRDCVRNFFFQNYDKVLESANASAKDRFKKIFSRGKASRMKLEAKQSREIAISKTSYMDVGLSILTRLGFPFISLPGIFQLQPYLQLAVQYDVKQIIRLLKARVKGNTVASSTMTRYLRRKNACEQCVTLGQAFCDRQEAADAMLRGGHDETMDVCETKTNEDKEKCQKFFWTNPESGSLFSRAVCPCYKAVSGTRIQPRWITSISSCSDISWPDSEIEELKRASKDRDWRSGFAVADAGSRRIDLAEVDLLEPPKMKDCFGGYRCCGLASEGPSAPGKWKKVRCIHIKSLYSRSSWMHPKSACKYYTPTDVKGEWHHAVESCGDGKDEGHYKWDKLEKAWIKEEPSELEHELVEAEELDQTDNE